MYDSLGRKLEFPSDEEWIEVSFLRSTVTIVVCSESGLGRYTWQDLGGITEGIVTIGVISFQLCRMSLQSTQAVKI